MKYSIVIFPFFLAASNAQLLDYLRSEVQRNLKFGSTKGPKATKGPGETKAPKATKGPKAAKGPKAPKTRRALETSELDRKFDSEFEQVNFIEETVLDQGMRFLKVKKETKAPKDSKAPKAAKATKAPKPTKGAATRIITPEPVTTPAPTTAPPEPVTTPAPTTAPPEPVTTPAPTTAPPEPVTTPAPTTAPPEPVTTPAPTTAPPEPVSNPAADAWVLAHNTRRAKYHAQFGAEYAPVEWDDILAAQAQSWADNLISREGVNLFNILVHADSSTGLYGGENLAASLGGSAYSEDGVLNRWAEGEENLAWMANGHFTQVIWRFTKYIGCGRASQGNLYVEVCRYVPPGNCGNYGQTLTNDNVISVAMQDTTPCGPFVPPTEV